MRPRPANASPDSACPAACPAPVLARGPTGRALVPVSVPVCVSVLVPPPGPVVAVVPPPGPVVAVVPPPGPVVAVVPPPGPVVALVPPGPVVALVDPPGPVVALVDPSEHTALEMVFWSRVTAALRAKVLPSTVAP